MKRRLARQSSLRRLRTFVCGPHCGQSPAGGTPRPTRLISLLLQSTSGLTTRKFGNRPKSRSADHSSRTPCWRQSAAMRASWIRPPVSWHVASKARNSDQCCSASVSNTRLGDWSHASTCSRADAMGVGGLKTREFVAIARNSCRQGQGIAQRARLSANSAMRRAAAL